MNTRKIHRFTNRILSGLALAMVLLPAAWGQATFRSGIEYTHFAPDQRGVPIEIFEGEPFSVAGHLESHVHRLPPGGAGGQWTYRFYLTDGKAEIPVNLSSTIKEPQAEFNSKIPVTELTTFGVNVPGFQLNRHSVDKVNLTLRLQRSNSLSGGFDELVGACAITVVITPDLSKAQVKFTGEPVKGKMLTVSFVKPTWATRTALLQNGKVAAESNALTLNPLDSSHAGSYAARVYYGPLGRFVDGPVSRLVVKANGDGDTDDESTDDGITDGGSTDDGSPGDGSKNSPVNQPEDEAKLVTGFRGNEDMHRQGSRVVITALLAQGVSRKTHTFVWIFNHKPIARNTARLVIKSIQPDDVGGYTFQLTPKTGGATFETDTRVELAPGAAVAAPPVVRLVGGNRTVKAGKPVTLKAVLKPKAKAGDFTFEWQQDGQVLKQTGPILHLTSTKETRTATYTLLVKRGGSTVQTLTTKLTVK